MGEALITRRGTGSGRFAVGKVKKDSGEWTLSVSGLNFRPKDIRLFYLSSDGLTTAQLYHLIWSESRGVVSYRADGYYGGDFSVVTHSDGFTIEDTERHFRFNGTYCWFAFEKEQEV